MQSKILVVGQDNVATSTGGAITVFREFCYLLTRNGYRVTAMCHSKDNVVPQWTSQVENLSFVNTMHKYGENFPNGINQFVMDEQPALIVFFFPGLYRAAHLSKEFNGIPRILMFHSRPDFYFEIEHGLKRRLKRYYVNTYAHVLLDSFVKLLPSYILKGPVRVIPNAVTIPAQMADYSVEHKKAVYYSRIDPCKGVDLLIEAFAKVAQKHPDWSVDVYGYSDVPGYLDKVNEMIERHGVANNVIIKGLATKSAPETLKDYDFCIFPSRFEGFGIGLAEAMAVGLPVIGLQNCSAVNEIILHGRNGLLCKDTAESLAQAINQMIESPQDRRRMGPEARKRVSKYSPESVERKWLELVDDAINPATEYPLAPVKKLVRYY